MNEITKVVLENEMDLILAHKQSMRLAELAGLSLSAQTTFATAVSEVSRNALGEKCDACLTLFVTDKAEREKSLVAVLEDCRTGYSASKDAGYSYARKLVSDISSTTNEKGNRIELNYRLPHTTRLDENVTEKWKINLNTDPAISPYEEIKRKNRQLIELADKLRESEQQYIALTDSLPIMIFTMKDDGTLTYANRWLNTYTGHTTDSLNESGWKSVLHPEDRKEVWADWFDKASGDTHLIIECRLKEESTGLFRWHTGICTAVETENRRVKCWNTYMVDIHAQKLIEAALKDNVDLQEMTTELQEKVRLLHLSNEQLERFAYVASHDLQEPLRKISLYSDFLDKKYRTSLPPEASVFFNNLIGSTERMRLLIKDVLAYSTVKPDVFAMVDLNAIGRELLEDLEIAIQQSGATLHFENLPSVEGNERQLRQLFDNLISNAIKFVRPGMKPVIHVSATSASGQVVLAFSDEGIGFEEEYLHKIFNLFQRLHSREKYSGTGIGLAICKRIAEFHGGSISAKSVPGNGATFYVRLPLMQLPAKS
ncbi:MAG: PAS domain S-box protein [Sphingobacteriales bacterium]|nr:MAG: PAS domain S-box protein [Sphingobacteriales bacterium]